MNLSSTTDLRGRMVSEIKLGKFPVAGKDDRSVLNFTVATEKYVGDGNGDIKSGQTEPSAYKTTFHKCVAFGLVAENIAKVIGQGDSIDISGENDYAKATVKVVDGKYVFDDNNQPIVYDNNRIIVNGFMPRGKSKANLEAAAAAKQAA